MRAQRCIRIVECELQTWVQASKVFLHHLGFSSFTVLALIPLNDEFQGSWCKPNNLFFHKLLWVSVFITIESKLIQILQPGEWGQLFLPGQ